MGSQISQFADGIISDCRVEGNVIYGNGALGNDGNTGDNLPVP